MISAKFFLGNVYFGGKLKIDAKNSNIEIFVWECPLFEISEYAFNYNQQMHWTVSHL